MTFAISMMFIINFCNALCHGCFPRNLTKVFQTIIPSLENYKKIPAGLTDTHLNLGAFKLGMAESIHKLKWKLKLVWSS